MTSNPVDAAPGDAAARERLARVFAGFDRLTPDELGRLGYRLAADEERDELLDAVDDAAVRTGRTALVDEARREACDVVLQRYAAGTLHPTWVGLNWGLSQGTAEDRVAIVVTLADAAAAAVVEDALDPEVAAALALDAQDLVGLASGFVYEGALARALDETPAPDLGSSRAARGVRLGFAVLVVAMTAFGIAASIDVWVGIAAAVLAGLLVLAVNRRPRGAVEV